MSPRRPRIRLLAALATAAYALLPATASAGPLVRAVEQCDNGAVSQPFLPWLDPAHYFLVDGGDFSGDAASWTLAGASVADGALRLPAGTSATAPTVCVGLEHPTTRFFLRRTGGLPTATVRVEAITERADGTAVAVPVGAVPAGSSWAPSPQLLNVVNLLPLLPGEHAPMTLRFTAQNGSVAIDDVYVDPYSRN